MCSGGLGKRMKQDCLITIENNFFFYLFQMKLYSQQCVNQKQYDSLISSVVDFSVVYFKVVWNPIGTHSMPTLYSSKYSDGLMSSTRVWSKSLLRSDSSVNPFHIHYRWHDVKRYGVVLTELSPGGMQ